MCKHCYDSSNPHGMMSLLHGNGEADYDAVPGRTEPRVSLEMKRDESDDGPALIVVPSVFRGDRVLLCLHGGVWEFPCGTVKPYESMGKAVVRILHEQTKMSASFSHIGVSQEHIDEPSKIHAVYLYVVGQWRGGLIDEKRVHDIRFFTKAGLAEVILDPKTKHALEQFGKRPSWAT
jgi:ADP-ribose pyrophosphatase YjhB (NUDIX family)